MVGRPCRCLRSLEGGSRIAIVWGTYNEWGMDRVTEGEYSRQKSWPSANGTLVIFRPMLGNSPPSESYIHRNGRQQSPQPQQRLQHPPYSQGSQNGHSSISQNVASIQQPQPRPVSTMQQPRDFDTEYSLPRPAPIPGGSNPRSSSRPNSYAHPREDREVQHHQGPGTPRL